MSAKYSFLIVGSLLIITSFSAVKHVRADWLIDLSGALVEIDGSVLGRGNEVATTEALKTTTQTRIKSQDSLQQMTQSRLEIQEGAVMQVRQELKNQDGQLVRHNQVDLEPGKKLKIERENGRFFELSADDKGRFEIIDDKLKARTNLPISIGEDNSLIITRPDGTTKTVTILPDVAADNLRARGLAISKEMELELEDIDGVAAYRFPVKQEKRFLGLFKRTYNQESVVSAETGEILETVSTETSPLTRFLEALSF